MTQCSICSATATHQCLDPNRSEKSRCFCRDCALIHRRTCRDCIRRRAKVDALRGRLAPPEATEKPEPPSDQG